MEFISFMESWEKEPSLQLVKIQRLFENEKDPYLFEKIDYIRQNMGGFLHDCHSEGLLHLSCYFGSEVSILYLLGKGEDPNQLSPNQTTPLTILIQNLKIKKEKKIQILYKLIESGLSFEVPKWAIKTHQNFYNYIESFGMLDWLKAIDKNQHVLNTKQKEQWKTIRFQLLYK